MSVKLSLKSLNGLSTNEKWKIDKLTITVGTEDVDVFDVVKEPSGRSLVLPFAFACSSLPKLKHIQSASSHSFTGTLRPNQQSVRDAAIKSLNDTRVIIISAEPGFGKTITAIEMICTINVPTVIFVKQAMIMNQWKDAIAEYAPDKKTTKITSKPKPIDPTADIYLINPIILKKDIKDTNFTSTQFDHIKLVVVDELHQIVTKVLHKAFFKFQPNYMIGLSATPYRPKMDPFEPAIAWFFGTNTVGSKLFRKHIVYCVKTNFVPETRIQPHTGKLDWSSVLTSQAENPQRNQLIVDTVRRFPERTWLILVKRVEHARILQTLFATEGVESETIVGSCREFDKKAKILIGTTPKIGVGFDHTPIDALCMAADVLEYFEQFLGRCMRRQDVEPIIIDFKDKFNPLINHLNSRIKKYVEHGGKILTLVQKNDNANGIDSNANDNANATNDNANATNDNANATTIKLPRRRVK